VRELLRFFRRGLDKKGQSTAEYIIIVVIVAVLSIAVVTIFGKRIRALFAYSANEITGEDGTDPTGVGGDADDQVEKGLGDW
jgi:Flp pilus assembly pilin Flp